MTTKESTKEATYNQTEIRAKVDALGQWFHNIDLHGVQTAPNHFLGDFPTIKWKNLCRFIPADLSGKTVLDIGCNGGFYSFELKKRGAAKVVAVDTDERYLNQARFAAEVLNLDVEFHRMSVYDVGRLNERFDIVLFMGVLYHLRYPLLALDLLAEHVVKDLLVFQTLTRGVEQVLELESDYPFVETAIFDQPGYPALYFVEKSYSGDPTNWWIPNRACAEAMLRSAGFRVTGRADDDTFVCQRTRSNEAVYYLEELRGSAQNL